MKTMSGLRMTTKRKRTKMIKLSVGDYVTYTSPAGLVSVVKILHFNSNGTVLVKYLNGSTVHVPENKLSLY